MLTKPVKKYRLQTFHAEILNDLKFCNNKCNVNYLNKMVLPPEWYPVRTKIKQVSQSTKYLKQYIFLYHF